MAAGSGGAPAGSGTQDTRVFRQEEGLGLQTTTPGNSLYDANWPSYALTPATLTIGAGNAGVTYTASAYFSGLIGNSIKVAHVTAGTNTPLSVSVNGYTVTVKLATDGSGVATSTAAQVAAAVNGAVEGTASQAGGYVQTGTQQLVVATLPGTGASLAVAQAATALSGASAGTVTTFDSGRAAGVEPARASGQVDTQWENSGLDPWASLKAADPNKW